MSLSCKYSSVMDGKSNSRHPRVWLSRRIFTFWHLRMRMLNMTSKRMRMRMFKKKFWTIKTYYKYDRFFNDKRFIDRYFIQCINVYLTNLIAEILIVFNCFEIMNVTKTCTNRYLIPTHPCTTLVYLTNALKRNYSHSKTMF